MLPFVRLLLDHLRDVYLASNDIHAIVNDLALDEDRAAAILATYYDAQCTLALSSSTSESVPRRPSDTGTASALFNNPSVALVALFGGQGNVDDYFSELTRLHSTYGALLEPLFGRCVLALSSQVSSDEAAATGLYSRGFDIAQWIKSPETRPPLSYLVSAPISMPLIGLTQLLAFWVVVQVLRLPSFGELLSRFKGTTGHSQGTC